MCDVFVCKSALRSVDTWGCRLQRKKKKKKKSRRKKRRRKKRVVFDIS